VKYIFSHAGGTIPFLATRFAIVDEMKVVPATKSGEVPPTLCVVFTGTPRCHGRTRSCRCSARSVGMDQVLFGSDYPYLRRDLAIRCGEEMHSTSELSEKERRRF